MRAGTLRPGVLLPLFFLSGTCGLVYEIVWMRAFTAAFGVTVYATSVVLAAFMGGLALGSALVGRLVERHGGAELRIYAYLEIGVGLYAALVPHVLDALPSLYQAIFLRGWDGPVSTLAVRLAASLLVLLVPTAMMGGTLPALSRLLAAGRAAVGREGGRLYAVNTFGAVVGALAAGFVLVPALGMSRTSYLAAALNVLVGLAALALDGRLAAPRLPDERWSAKGRRASGGARPVEEAAPPGYAARPLLLVAGLSGFSALSYEVVWTRVLSIITFNTVFAFTSMLAAFLTGIAAGGYLFARVIDRRKALWAWLAAFQAGIGAYALLSPLLFGRLAEHVYRYQAAAALEGASWWAFAVKQFVLAEAVMALPTVLMGASFPATCKLYAAGTGRTASGVGDVCASNTAGAVLGAAVPALVLVPAAGLKGALGLAAAVNLAAAAVAWTHGAPRGGRARVRAAAAPLVAGLVLVFANVDVAFTGVAARGREIVFHHEDATGVVEVFQQGEGRWLVTNRLHSEGSNLPEALYLQRKQGLLPIFLHPDPASLIEVGLGTGIGFAPVLLDERVTRAEMVEISPGVVKAAALFGAENLRLLESPRLRLRVDDGRNYLLLTPERYDVIVLGLFTPYRAGVGDLYSRELYLLCRERLKKGGMLFQWLALSQLSPEGLRIVLGTVRSVFPYVYLWDKGYYLAVMGMTEEMPHGLAGFRAALRSPGLRAEVERWQLADPYAFLASFLMGPDGVAAFAGGAPLNTQDRPRIEFGRVKAFEAAYSPTYAGRNLAALLEHRRPPDRILGDLDDEARAVLARYVEARGHALRGLVHDAQGRPREAYAAFRLAARTNGRDDIARFALRRFRDAAR